MLRVGLNPYGLSYTIGLQGAGSVRANPAPMQMDAFIGFALSAATVLLIWRRRTA